MGSLWFGVIWDTFIYDFLTRVIVTLFNRNYDGQSEDENGKNID